MPVSQIRHYADLLREQKKMESNQMEEEMEETRSNTPSIPPQ